MVKRTRPQPPFSSFGWSLSGALLIALSLPLGVYPLAWVGLVPLIARWAVRRPTLDYIRELYALLLTTSCCVGFWLLFNPNASTAAMGGVTLFLVPIPLVVAFTVSNVVRERIGLIAGLVALALNVLAAEFITLALGFSIPWLVLGYTQADAVEFIQMADLGGVLLLSLWVLLLNFTAFLALPRTDRAGDRYGERGVSMAIFTALVAIPVAYGGVRTAQADVPAGYTSVGIVQPGIAPTKWDRQSPTERIDHLASLSDDLLTGAAPATTDADPLVRNPSDVDLLIWPQTSVPYMGTDEGESQLYDRLQRWAASRSVTLLAGAETAPTGVERGARPPKPGELANSVVMFSPDRPSVRYDQMRAVPYADRKAAPGNNRVLFEANGAEIATTVGFESVFGDHVRQFTRDGADLIVVLSRNDLWGRSAGLYQHLQFTRLRAIESRRSVVISTVGGISALIEPNGQIEQIAGWRHKDTQTIQVPTFRGETFYVRHGDWIGRWALAIALIFNLGAIGLSLFAPELVGTKRLQAQRPARHPSMV